MKITTRTIRERKNKASIVALTAYDAINAALADRAEIDLILVGDSVGTTLLGWETTIPVTLDIMLHHTAAVSRGCFHPLIVADLPFVESRSPYEIMLNACLRLVQESGAEAIKVEGGQKMAGRVKQLTTAGIPVLGHIGLLPQEIHQMGGYRKFGKTEEEKESLLKDALALEEAGVFAIIAEMVEPSLAGQITQKLNIPLIGIGCGKDCDGQILVSTDLLGLNPGKYPSFAKKYANLAEQTTEAFKAYADEVRQKQFP